MGFSRRKLFQISNSSRGSSMIDMEGNFVQVSRFAPDELEVVYKMFRIDGVDEGEWKGLTHDNWSYMGDRYNDIFFYDDTDEYNGRDITEEVLEAIRTGAVNASGEPVALDTPQRDPIAETYYKALVDAMTKDELVAISIRAFGG